jgi:hypothetical protein
MTGVGQESDLLANLMNHHLLICMLIILIAKNDSLNFTGKSPSSIPPTSFASIEFIALSLPAEAT